LQKLTYIDAISLQSQLDYYLIAFPNQAQIIIILLISFFKIIVKLLFT